MELKVLGSSSRGNCYILENENEALIIECGVRMKDIKKALNFNVSKVKGCIVSHEHGDHAASLSDVLTCGIPVYALQEVFNKRNVKHGTRIAIRENRGCLLGNFKVFSFPAHHDVPCVGFHISHPECGNIFFLTDSSSCDYIFPTVDHIMIEANYKASTLSKAIDEGRTQAQQMGRLFEHHMELQDCIDVINTMNTDSLQDILLMHLSDNNSDERLFLQEVQRQTGKPVRIANPGLVIDIARF